MTRESRPPASTEPRDPALELLRDLGPKAALSPTAKKRIAAALQAPRTTQSRVWLLAFPAMALVALISYMVARSQSSPRAPSVAFAAQQLVVPSCGISRITSESLHYRSSFVGPAEASIETDGMIALRSGRAVITTGDRRASVSTATARISIEPNSLVEIIVRNYRAARVAAFSGRADVAISSPQSVIRVDGGSSWDDGILKPSTSTQARDAHEIADDDAATLRLCPGEASQSASSPPTVITVPRQPPRADTPKPALPRRLHVATTEPAVPPPQGAASVPELPIPAATNSPPRPSAAAVLGNAIRQLRVHRDPHGAIALLDDLEAGHSVGEFSQETKLIRIEALQQLGQSDRVLALLDTLALPSVPRGGALILLRAELRAEQKRYREAIDDYSTSLAHDGLSEKALIGRAECRFKLGDDESARTDLVTYLKTYPAGKYATDARRALDRAR